MQVPAQNSAQQNRAAQPNRPPAAGVPRGSKGHLPVPLSLVTYHSSLPSTRCAYGELELHLTHTKQKTGPISNHGIYRFYKNNRPSPVTRTTPRAFSDHASLTTCHCFSNRQPAELESSVTRTKQSLGSFLIATNGTLFRYFSPLVTCRTHLVGLLYD